MDKREEIKMDVTFPKLLNEFWKQAHVKQLWKKAIETEDILERYEIIRGIVMKIEEIQANKKKDEAQTSQKCNSKMQ